MNEPGIRIHQPPPRSTPVTARNFLLQYLVKHKPISQPIDLGPLRAEQRENHRMVCATPTTYLLSSTLL